MKKIFILFAAALTIGLTGCQSFLEEETYGLLNAKVSFTKGDLQLDVWGKNLLNTKYHAFLFESGPAAFAQAGKPMQLGANISYKW